MASDATAELSQSGGEEDEGGGNAVASTEEVLRNDVQKSKVVELSKRLRAVNLALQKERSRRMELEKQMNEASTDQHPLDNHRSLSNAAPNADAAAREVVAEAAEAAEAAEKRAEEWREKAQAMQSRAERADSRLATTKAENDRLRNALRRELGTDDSSVEKAIADGSSWRGRAEQISLLRDKVRELREQLDAQQQSDASRHADTHESTSANGRERGGSPLSPSQASSSTDTAVPSQRLHSSAGSVSANKAHVRKIEERKREELQRAENEAEKAKADAATAKKRLESANARRQTLEREVSSLKEKVSALLKKSENDDKLIDRLRQAQQSNSSNNCRTSSDSAEDESNSTPTAGVEGFEAYVRELENRNKRQEQLIRQLNSELLCNGNE